MKYVKSGIFTTKQLSISETVTEISDVIDIAKDVIKNAENQELKLALDNLNQATHYLKYIEEKTKIALKYVPTDIQEKEYL